MRRHRALLEHALGALVRRAGRNAAIALGLAALVALLSSTLFLSEALRAEYEKVKVAANIRRLTLLTGLSTKDIYALFPKAPGRTIARIAGTPKPAGCL